MTSEEIWDLIINNTDQDLYVQFRASRSTRSGRPGNQADESIFDGLPVRQWRLQDSTVGGALSSDSDPSKAALNGPHGSHKHKPEQRMPSGSHLYAPWCQQLLRAARTPRLPKRAEPSDGREEDKENDDDQGHAAAAQAQQSEAPQEGFLAPKWTPVPKHLEEPDRAYLAKRRKGLPSAYAAGRSSLTGANGHTLASGTTVTAPDGTVVTVEEPRRRMPPPRRKPKKGPGRRKTITETEGQGVSASADSLIARTNGQNGTDGGHANGETEHGDAKHDDEDDEDGDEDDDGEEGEEDEDEDDEDHEDGEIIEPVEEKSATAPTTTQVSSEKADDPMPKPEHEPEHKMEEEESGIDLETKPEPGSEPQSEPRSELPRTEEDASTPSGAVALEPGSVTDHAPAADAHEMKVAEAADITMEDPPPPAPLPLPVTEGQLPETTTPKEFSAAEEPSAAMQEVMHVESQAELQADPKEEAHAEPKASES